jgi:hypothetical protein
MDATLEDGFTAVSRMLSMEAFLCNGSGGPAMVKGLWFVQRMIHTFFCNFQSLITPDSRNDDSKSRRV